MDPLLLIGAVLVVGSLGWNLVLTVAWLRTRAALAHRTAWLGAVANQAQVLDAELERHDDILVALAKEQDDTAAATEQLQHIHRAGPHAHDGLMAVADAVQTQEIP